MSYSAAVALQMAADSASWVHRLMLLEPPPVHVPSAAQFFVANAQLVEDYHAYGPVAGLDRFLTRMSAPRLAGRDDRALPGSGHPDRAAHRHLTTMRDAEMSVVGFASPVP